MIFTQALTYQESETGFVSLKSKEPPRYLIFNISMAKISSNTIFGNHLTKMTRHMLYLFRKTLTTFNFRT